MAIATSLLPSATANAPYSAVLNATGGTPAYTWAVTSGQLPAGIALASSTGVISGTPTVTGNFAVGLTLTDAATPNDKKVSTVTIAVAPPPLTMAPTTTLVATYGVPFSQALTLTGGSPAYTWSVASGKLPSGLSLDSSAGIISGTPTGSGTISFTVAVRDGEVPANTQSSVVTMNIASNQLKIAPTASATANVGTVFSETLQTTGGTPAYKWSIVGSLPAGLALNSSTGTISGVPSVSGTTTFTAMVNDSSNPIQASSASISITVAATPLNIAASTLPSVMVGTAYSQTLQVSGGTAPYKWTITSGQLAPGLTLNTAGTISGTPTTSGSSSFTATATDSSSPTQSASTIKAVTVIPTPLQVTAPVLPARPVGSAYSQSFSVTGGTAPYTWRITSGSLPAGLTLSTSGTVSGTAQASGASSFTATVSDSSSPAHSASATAGLTITPTSLVITSSALASVTVGSSYSQSLVANGGTAPYSWSINSGTLPTGLSLTPSSGVISGTPSTSGTSSFTVTVVDSSNPAQTTSTTSSVSVTPTALSIPSTTLAQATSGTAYLQTLQAAGGTGAYIWSITSGQLPLGLSLSGSGVISGTPSSSTSASFTVKVADSGSPAQTQSANLTITAVVPSIPPLSIVSSNLSAGTTGSSYSQTMQATGGTPGYSWHISSGTLPAGLALSATTGAITGTPTTAGTSNFTASLTDNGSPAQTQSIATSITVAAAQAAGPGTTWFVRSDGGTRYSANVPTGQCDGKSDVAYPGAGTNQHCAFNDFRYMWDDDSGYVGAGAWVIAGGDTVVIRSCHALPTQQNPSGSNCRIGWDQNGGGGASNLWCQYIGSYTCYNPPIPAGTASQHTRILGGCAYGTYSCTPIDNNYPYANTNETQIFGGMGLTWTFNLGSTRYVDVEGIELTTHNGVCVTSGSPAYPRNCNTSPPLDDYANNGFLTNNQTADLTLQDVYIHGFNSSGIYGPIGGAITATRVFSGFNAFAGWNFADGADTPDASGSQILASYVTTIGNGCYEQYPIVNSRYPAQACYDTNTNGFGDAWSGQDTELDVLHCDHCYQMYNTKDGWIGPHVQVADLKITNSVDIGNMGSAYKWGQTLNSTIIFENNLVVGNCYRMEEALPGAAQNFNISTGLPGSYLTGYCRAGGNTFAVITRSGSNNLYANNTIVGANNILVEQNCGYYSVGNVFNQETNCGSVPIVFKNNNFLGYLDPNVGQVTTLFYVDVGTTINFTSSFNNEYGLRKGDPCGGTILCSDPLLVNEPAQPWPGTETDLDTFNPFLTSNSFRPTSSSPLIGAGAAVSGAPLTDYYGTVRSTPSTIGAVEP